MGRSLAELIEEVSRGAPSKKRRKTDPRGRTTTAPAVPSGVSGGEPPRLPAVSGGSVPAGAGVVARVPAEPDVTLEDHAIREFCHNYLFVKGFNGTQAYLAIKPQVTIDTAGVQASRLLATDRVKAAMAQMVKAAWERNELDADYIVRNWVAMSQANVYDYFTENADGTIASRPVKDLTLEQQRNVRKLKIINTRLGTEDAAIFEQRIELEVVDRKGVLDSMAKASGLFGKLDTGENKDGDVAALIERAFERVRKLAGARTFDNSTGAQIPDGGPA